MNDKMTKRLVSTVAHRRPAAGMRSISQPAKPDHRVVVVASWLVAGVLVLAPFHAFFTVWLASAVGHYTMLRLWSVGVLGLLCTLIVWLLAMRRLAWQSVVKQPGFWIIAALMVLSLIWGVVAHWQGGVNGKALAYGWWSDLRYLLFFVVAGAVAGLSNRLHNWWPRLVLLPASVVILIAILQYAVLPADVLRHFGYGPDTIQPMQTINSNAAYVRVMATLRGANPLGAYLVIIIGLFAACWRRLVSRELVYVTATAFALVYSFSRSAWIGAVMCLVIVFGLRTVVGHRRPGRRMTLLVSAAAMLAFAIVIIAGQHDRTVQNLLYHTDDSATVAVSSNDQRESALRRGLHDVATNPVGDGPGTAGPASQYNSGHRSRLAENYYLQIGQELGWLGLGLFVAVQAAVLRALYVRRTDILSLGLFASGIGLVVVNMLSHAWADDTLAFVWWGLAGIALAVQPKEPAAAKITKTTATKYV